MRAVRPRHRPTGKSAGQEPESRWRAVYQTGCDSPDHPGAVFGPRSRRSDGRSGGARPGPRAAQDAGPTGAHPDLDGGDLVGRRVGRRSGPSSSASRNRSWVAQAGSATADDEGAVPQRDGTARGPRSLGADELGPVGEHRRGHARPTARPGCAPAGRAPSRQRRGSAPDDRRQRLPRHARASWPATTGSADAVTAPSSTRRTELGLGARRAGRRRVVSRVWPGGQVARAGRRCGPGRARRTRRRAAARAALPAAVGDHPVGGEAQGERQRPLLALRGVGAGRQAADGELDVVAVRADEWTRPGAGRPRRAAASAAARPCARHGGRVGGASTSAGACGHLGVGRGQHRRQPSSRSGAAVGQRPRPPRPAWRPTRRG